MNTDSFPSKGIGYSKISGYLFKLLLRTGKAFRNAGLSELVSPLYGKFSFIISRMALLNPNNHGNWSGRKVDPVSSYGMEKELIRQMLDLYKADEKEIGGYMTSGATEGNLYSAWIGVKYLEKHKIGRKQISMLITGLTHHSLTKAADITGVEVSTVPLNETDWAFDVSAFEKKVKELTKKGFKGFLVPLTLGYTLTGTSDDYKSISDLIARLEKSNKVHFFAWLDAAFNGMIEPFVDKSFTPFKDKQIQVFITDMHKLGLAPIPAGLVLYRKKLLSLIETEIKYLKFSDTTLLGSRPGLSAIYAWTVINSLGKDGFRERINENLKRRNKFIEKHSSKDISFIVSQNSINCGIVVRRLGYNELNFEKKYGLEFIKTKLLFVSGTKEILISKSFFNKHDQRT